jgi:hypothetical protein
MNKQGICLNCGQNSCQNVYEKKDDRLNCYSQCYNCGSYMRHWKYESFHKDIESKSDCDPGRFIINGEYWYDFMWANMEGNLITESDAKYKVDVTTKKDKPNRRKEHQQYLKTSQWQDMRLKVLKRDDYTCQGCLENPATEVHHITYDNWKNEFMFELMSLCRECHSRFHKKDKQ